MAAQLNSVRLKLEQRRKRIEDEKRKMENVMVKQREKVGQEAFLRAVVKGTVIRLTNLVLVWLIHYVRFSRFYCHFWANLVMHICSMLQVRIIAIWSQGLILNSVKSYTTFGTKILVFRANSGCHLGTKWQK